MEIEGTNIMQKNNMERLHETLIEILDYVVSVCEENGLRYFLIYGSALGAYRHQGFIPWDDDLDIGLPREDYEKFLKIMEKQPSKLYCLQNDSTEDKYYLTFSKVRKQGTLFMESIAEGMYRDNGIFVDIFPLDYVTDKTSLGHKMKEYMIAYLNHTLRYAGYRNAYSKSSPIKHAIEHVICLPAFVLPKKWIVNIIKRLNKGRCQEADAKYLVEYCDLRYRWAQPVEYYFPPKKMSFAGKEYNVPGQIESYLSATYGDDYMQLPPEEDRVTHLPLELKF